MDNLERCRSVLSLLSLLRMFSHAVSTGMTELMAQHQVKS